MKLIASNGQTPPSVLVGYEGEGGDDRIDAGAGCRPRSRLDPAFQPGLRHLALRVSDFDKAGCRLKALGITFLFEPVQAVGGGKVVSFRDPEGNELQIVQRTGKVK